MWRTSDKRGSRRVRTPVVLGLDFGGTKIAAAVADLQGNRLAEGITGTEPCRGVLWNFDQGARLARGLMRTAGHDGERRLRRLICRK